MSQKFAETAALVPPLARGLREETFLTTPGLRGLAIDYDRVPSEAGIHLKRDALEVRVPVERGLVTSIQFCSFDEAAATTATQELPLKLSENGDFFYGTLTGTNARAGLLYGLKVEHAYEGDHSIAPGAWAVDPYARAILPHVLHAPESGIFPAQQNFCPPLSLEYYTPPKGIVVDWDNVQERVAELDSVRSRSGAALTLESGRWNIYASFPQGLTRQMSLDATGEITPGTIASLSSPKVISYLQGLNVTHLQLNPIQSGVDDWKEVQLGRKHVWGYIPEAFCALNSELFRAGQPEDQFIELAKTVRALRAANIELVLDLVFHTSEGGGRRNEIPRPNTILAPFGEHLYYQHEPDGTRRILANDTYNFHTFNVNTPEGQDLVLRTFKTWTDLGVRCFRIDQAALLCLDESGHPNSKHPFLQRLYNQLAAIDPTITLVMEPYYGGSEPFHDFPSGPISVLVQDFAQRHGADSFFSGQGGKHLVANIAHGSRGESASRIESDRHIDLVSVHDGLNSRDRSVKILEDLLLRSVWRHYFFGHAAHTDHPEGKILPQSNQLSEADRHEHLLKALRAPDLFERFPHLQSSLASFLSDDKRALDPDKMALALHLARYAHLALGPGGILLRGRDEVFQTQHGDDDPYHINGLLDLNWAPKGLELESQAAFRTLMALRAAMGFGGAGQGNRANNHAAYYCSGKLIPRNEEHDLEPHFYGASYTVGDEMYYVPRVGMPCSFMLPREASRWQLLFDSSYFRNAELGSGPVLDGGSFYDVHFPRVVAFRAVK